MRDAIASLRTLTKHVIDESMARAESWNAFNNAYVRARTRGLPPEAAYDEAAEAQVRAYHAIMGPEPANDRFSPDHHLDACLSVAAEALNRTREA